MVPGVYKRPLLLTFMGGPDPKAVAAAKLGAKLSIPTAASAASTTASTTTTTGPVGKIKVKKTKKGMNEELVAAVVLPLSIDIRYAENMY